MSKTLLSTLLFLAYGITTTLPAQNQLGNTIFGESIYDESGFSVDMPDSVTIGIGAISNYGGAINSGHARVYTYLQGNWVQKGNDIDGVSSGEQFGVSLSMGNADIIAIGGPKNSSQFTNAGQVRVYEWVQNAWTMKGNPLNGTSTGEGFGQCISMGDAMTLAIGAPLKNGVGTAAGAVFVYHWNGTAWVQKGSSIDGTAQSDRCGEAVAMAGPNTLAVAFTGSDNPAQEAGMVRIYSWNGSNWLQKGGDLLGVSSFDRFGESLSMPDSQTVVVGTPRAGMDGTVQVYSWNGSAWVQKGQTLQGPALTSEFGCSVDMADADHLVVGSWGNDTTSFNVGTVQSYFWSGAAWVAIGTPVIGDSINDGMGFAVSMPSPTIMAGGARFGNAPAGTNEGYVRVFELPFMTTITKGSGSMNIGIYPNPASDWLHAEVEGMKDVMFYAVRNMVGQLIIQGEFSPQAPIPLSPYLPAGLYLLEISNMDGMLGTARFVKD